ncbi:MAG: hypothetical protein CMF62_10395 [Magnetococcales bacterium]|nr:hypothetical protein [Magnetococcales bacterium]
MKCLTLAYTYNSPKFYVLGALSVFLFLAPLNAKAEVKNYQTRSTFEFYGQVNKSFVGYADGEDADVGVYDNNISSTRFGFKNSNDLGNGYFANMLLEVQMNGRSNSRTLQQGAAGTAASDVTERHARVGLGHKKVGALYIGRTSTASDGITEIDLAPLQNALTATPARHGAALEFRNKNTGALTGLQMSQVVDSFEGMQFAGGSASDGTNAYGAGFTDRFDLISYVSPRVNGFEFSAAAIQGGDHDFALRYQNDFEDQGLQVQAGVAYVDYRTVTGTAPGSNEVSGQWSGSASVKSDNGFGATVAYGRRTYEHRAAGIGTPQFYYTKVGYSWDGWGIALEHGRYKNIDTTTAADTSLYTYGVGVERDLGHGVGLSVFARNLDLDRDGLAVEQLYVYGTNLKIKF